MYKKDPIQPYLDHEMKTIKKIKKIILQLENNMDFILIPNIYFFVSRINELQKKL